MGSNGWTWVQTEDLRGLAPSKVAGGVGTSDHGSLGGLADDDHTQYSLVDGTRDFTGNVTVNGIVNAYAYDTGNYRIDETSSRLQFINELGAGDAIFDFLPAKSGGDGEDDNFVNIWATGGVSAEYLKVGYESDLSPQRYVIEAFAISGGTYHPIYFVHSDSDVMTIDSNGLTLLDGHGITLNSGDITSNSGNITLNSGNIALTDGTITIDDAPVAKILNINKTIYLRTTGDDSNGGYASDDAFLTPERVITELHKWIAEDYLLSVNVGEGTFNCPVSLDPTYAYGDNTSWTGNASEYTSRTINNIDVSTTALITGLEYIDFDVSLPSGSGAAVGHFILVKATSGGSNPNLVKGCHEIVTWNGTTNVATVRCVRVAGSTTLPSGGITGDSVTLVRTVLHFSADDGIEPTSYHHCGTWDSMVFKGVISRVAVKVREGATIVLGENFGSSQWGVNLSCHAGATIYADSSVHSYTDIYTVSVSTRASVSLRNAILNGAKIRSIRSFEGASVDFVSGQVYCGGTTRIIRAYIGGFVIATDSVIEGCISTGTVAFHVTSGGGIYSYNTSTDASTHRGQDGPTLGNGSYHAY
jgi:hypothetical protein